VDRIYPASNAALYRAVLEKGCLISEFIPGTQPYKWNFPKRNRVISGISHGVLIVEAPEKSGAMITARQALDHGKELFAVPGNVNAESARGSNQLISDGAAVAQCGGDILEYFQPRFPYLSIRDGECPQPQELEAITDTWRRTGHISVKKTEETSLKNKKDIDNPAKPPYIDVEKCHLQLSEQESAIVTQLTQGAKNLDEVVHCAGLSMGKAMSLLTMLEIKGVIRRLPGNLIALKE
jgi:DNA processing protein